MPQASWFAEIAPAVTAPWAEFPDRVTGPVSLDTSLEWTRRRSRPLDVSDVLPEEGICSELDDQLSAPIQRSPSPTFLTTSVPPRQGPRDGLDPSQHSPGTSTTEIGEQDHGQTEDSSEPLSSQGDNHEPGGPAKLPQRTQPHVNASQNDSACIDGDGKTTDGGDSDSSSDNEGGNDGDDDDYNDDGSSSHTDGEDDGYSKKRTPDRSPAARSFDSGDAESPPPDDNIEETPASSHKRQKVAHDRVDMTLPRLNSMPRSAGLLLRSPERPLTASMPSPPASHSLSETESDQGSDCRFTIAP
ncbi:hypothetical protein ACQRIU_001270 [Beauveria bassiana]